MDSYYKLRQLFYYKVRYGLLQIATGITKCDYYYKLRQNDCQSWVWVGVDVVSQSCPILSANCRYNLRLFRLFRGDSSGMDKIFIGNMSFIQLCCERGAKSHVAQEISGRGRRRVRDEKGNQGVGDFRFINILQFFSIYFFFPIDLFGYLYVVPNSNPLGIKRFFSEFPNHLNVNATL